MERNIIDNITKDLLCFILTTFTKTQYYYCKLKFNFNKSVVIRRNNFEKLYIFFTILSLFFIVFQYYFGTINKNYFHYFLDINNEKNDLAQKYKIINIENLKIKKKNLELSRYNNIYKSLNGKYNTKSYLSVLFINKNQNGHYIVAKSEKKLNINDIVINKKKIYIGRVVSVLKDNIVRIQLITDKKSFIPARTSNNIYGMLENDNIRNEVIFTPFNKKLNKKIINGDLITTSGQDNLMMQGIIVGKIRIEGDNIYVDTFIDDINDIAVIDNYYAND